MKTIITLCLAVFFMAGMQNTQAQTKEETIQWLNDYGKKIDLSGKLDNDPNDTYNIDFTGFDGEYLRFDVRKYFSGYGRYEEEYKILPKDILFTEVSTLGGSPFELKGKPSSFIFSGVAIGDKVSYKNYTKTDNANRTSMNIPFSQENSKDALRLIKAIMHLAKLSGADPLPKVSENTF